MYCALWLPGASAAPFDDHMLSMGVHVHFRAPTPISQVNRLPPVYKSVAIPDCQQYCSTVALGQPYRPGGSRLPSPVAEAFSILFFPDVEAHGCFLLHGLGLQL